uniref:F-box domain-containing protein n=1 Tax=Salix viminalis TaxID=40686 RepID=A0A6N2MMJ1_SALVM
MSCYISNLPNHILETIYSKVTISALKSCRDVCNVSNPVTGEIVHLPQLEHDKYSKANIICILFEPDIFKAMDLNELEKRWDHSAV